MVECYWLSDWNLFTPYEQHVVSHPCVNLAWTTPQDADVFGVDLGVTSVKLVGAGRVFGVKFRPGGFRAFVDTPMAELTGHRVPIDQIFGAGAAPISALMHSSTDDARRVTGADAFLSARMRTPTAATVEAMRLVQLIRTDRAISRVDEFARRQHLSARALQRLFADEIGASPKWVIRRYRIHEAIERAGTRVDWPRLALDLGYADQAHLIRDFTEATGVSPTAYVRMLQTSAGQVA